MGLLKTAAKVAVASSVHGRVQRRQQARWAAQDQAGAPPPVPPPPAPVTSRPSPQASGARARPVDMADRLAQLTQLGELMKAGILTQTEFDQQKARILNG